MSECITALQVPSGTLSLPDHRSSMGTNQHIIPTKANVAQNFVVQSLQQSAVMIGLSMTFQAQMIYAEWKCIYETGCH
jgi:hypothetical protein